MPPFRILLIAFIAVLTMSTVPVLIKFTAANEVTIGIARLSIALLLITPWIIRGLKPLTRNDWFALVIIGLVFAVHWLSYFASIKLATPTIAAMAISTYGVQYLLLAWLFNNEKFSLIDWLAIGTCFLGCVVVVPDWSLENETTLGIGIGLFSALLYATLPLLHQRSKQLSNGVRTWGQFAFALLFMLPLWPLSDWNLGLQDLMALLCLGVVSTVIAHGLWVKASTELPPLFTSLIYYLYVPFAMLQSVFFLDEALSAEKLIGAAMIVFSSIGISLYRAIQNNRAIA